MDTVYRTSGPYRLWDAVFQLTLRSAEVHGLGHGAHALRVSGLDLEVVGGVQSQLLDLMSQTVSHHWFDHPVVDLSVYVCAVVDNVAYRRGGRSRNEKINPGTHFAKK